MKMKLPARMTVTIWLLVIQMILIAAAAAAIIALFPFIWFIGFFISVLVLSFILKKDDASAYKITWIVMLLVFPAVGGIVYAIFGNKRPLKRISAHAQEHALIAKLLDSDGNLPFVNKVECGRMFSLMRYIRKSSSYHAYQNTNVNYFKMGETMFEEMILELEKAEKFIFFEFFIVKKSEMWDRLLEVMERKAAEGVDVRLIVDDLGSQKLFTNRYTKELRAKKIKILRFNPMLPFLLLFMNNRDHRKILVVDGNVAFTGGLNIADEYINKRNPYGKWKDTGLKLSGEAVWSFTLMFIEMWDTFCQKEERINDHVSYKPAENLIESTDGLVLPFGDSPLDREQLAENIYIDILNQAENYCYIFTPYLIISEKMIHALQMAAGRGVEVKLVTPGIPDKKFIYRLTRSYYSYLLKSGVKIYEYTPGFMHAKSFVCDDKIAVVGTINLDYRSLYLHFECGALLYESSVINEIKNDALSVISESHEVVLEEKRRSFFNQLLDSVLHLFAPLL